MKTIRWILLAVFVLGLVGLVLAGAEAAKAGGTESEVRALRQQIEHLQTRLKTLEERLAKVQSAQPRAVPRIEILPKSTRTPSAMIVPRLSELLGKAVQPPKTWGRCDVNGWPVYFIPSESR